MRMAGAVTTVLVVAAAAAWFGLRLKGPTRLDRTRERLAPVPHGIGNAVR